MRKLIAPALLVLALGACSKDADVASQNLPNDADNFLIMRRVVFVNGITDKYLLEIEGLCAIGTGTGVKAITVRCKLGPGMYNKHYMGLSDNVTYVVEQLDFCTGEYVLLQGDVQAGIYLAGHSTGRG